MSFITKRERVFNEYDPYDLPARNEGKLKAYASCTDARAWSHFCSDKTEHLVEVIKRNNETLRPKYVPTTVIVDTLMVAKNAEISRLKHRIEEFEQMLAAYDQLELSCDQKCEIVAAHAAIKAANKELDEMYLDLDLSGFTEGLDSEAFETGKSRGDGEEIPHQMFDAEEQTPPMTDVKNYQMGQTPTCDIGTYITDPRIDEMQDIIVSKDAKLNAMKNTIAVMENDVCEPYCIYAHIYTALEKIFGILCQNDKYRQYLNLLTTGKDTRSIDIKGKILFKLKVLEKFSVALIAPCNRDLPVESSNHDCECYRTEVITRIETNYAVTTAERQQPSIENKRAQLVADIIENEEMKDILTKQSFTILQEAEKSEDIFDLHDFNINQENLDRLKKLQENYDDLMVCYESLKHEKENFESRCTKYEELEKEFDNLKLQVNEYNSLWNEKEHYRKRSADLDILKEQYLILTDETSNLETQLKAEAEINNMKCKSIEELRNENIQLEKKLNDAIIAFEKEKNYLLCKLKEADCTVMCQGQQIKSLSIQIDRLLEQDKKTLQSYESHNTSVALIDEVESNRDQIKNLKDALFCNEEENINLQQQYQNQLQITTELRNELEDWKSAYEKTLQRNDYLEKYTASLIEENKVLSQDAKEKSHAIDNLMKMVDNKSQEINKLICESEKSKSDNNELCKQISKLQIDYENSVASLENEKLHALTYLQIARVESQELLDKVKNYDHILNSKTDLTKSLKLEIENKKGMLINAAEDNKKLKLDLASRDSNNSVLVQEIERLREIHEFENKQYSTALELSRKESSQLRMKLSHYEALQLQLQSLQDSHEKLREEKKKIESELIDKKNEFDNIIHSMQLTKRESYELMDKLQRSEDAKDELLRLNDAYQKLAIEKQAIECDLTEKKNQIEKLLQTLNKMKLSNEHLQHQCRQLDFVTQELENLRKSYDELLSEKNEMVMDSNAKKEALNNYYNMLEQKIEENRELTEQIKMLQVNEIAAKNSLQSLHNNNLQTQAALNVVKKESAVLTNKIKQYENIETEYDQLRKAHDEMKLEKEKLQNELNMQLQELKRVEMQNFELHCHSQNLISHSEDLENALITSRTELIKNSTSPDNTYKSIIVEIEKLRQEKLSNQAKIRDLLDRLEESENIISNLSEDVSARNDRIAVLENHINALEDEVRQLHINLANMVSTGEEMKDLSFQKIDSLKTMEAHHSKATHNMKMELAKLQQQNAILEEQLSVTKIRSEESSRDNNLYVSQLVQLRDERETIVADIKDLEVTSVGESNLVPATCNIEDILLSLDRIRKCLDARNSKTTFLEKTILKVQTSSQLLLSKADEAKRLVEKEKQKIASEKEDAIKDRQHMERQLLELKEKLGEQVTDDRAIIQDLEATILNQKLLIDKLNKSTQKYISKLKEELEKVQELYHNSMAKIGELQEELQNVSNDRNNQKKILEKIKTDFEAKSLEVRDLQEKFEKIKNKPVVNFGTQTRIPQDYKETQTDEKANNAKKERKSNKLLTLEDIKGHNKSTQHEHDTDTQTKLINEVQILTAKVEPSFDYVRNSYTKYKIQRLSTVKAEQYSISRPSLNKLNNSPETFQESGESYSPIEDHNSTLVDIFKIQPINTDSSKINDYSENDTIEKSHNQSSSFFEFVTTDNKINGKYAQNKTVTNLQRGNLDKDFFVIYKDSYANREQENNKRPEMGGEEEAQSKLDRKRNQELGIDQDLFSFTEKTTTSKSVKQTLKINMPSIENDSVNSLTNSDGENRSLFSDKFVIYTSDTKINTNKSDRIITSAPSLPAIPFEEPLFRNKDSKDKTQRNNFKTKGTEADIKTLMEKRKMVTTKTETPTNFNPESHHKLSRVSANVLLLKGEKSNKLSEATVKQNARDFGLEFLLDSVKGEVSPDRTKHFTKVTRSRSYETLSNMKIENNTDFSTTRPLELKVTSNGFENNEPNKSWNKQFTEKSVMVKLDTDTNYENALNSLTKALENIEMDYKKKIEAIKLQYDNNIRCIINDHNKGVKNIQSLHEDTLLDMMKIHENEVENLRSMSIEAMRKAEKLEKENRALKTKVTDRGTVSLYEEPIKICNTEPKKRKKIRGDTKMLSKTKLEAFDVKPELRRSGPCTCTLDVNVSDTIRNIFEQVGVEQKKMAEETFTKYIANKIVTGNIETLDGNELSFLHLKVCQMFKTKLAKEQALQKRIDSLESELISKQRNTQQHIVDLDRNLEEERRRLQELCEAVCRATPPSSLACSTEQSSLLPLTSSPPTEDPFIIHCKPSVSVRRSAGDLGIKLRQRHNDRATTATLEVEERHREKKLYNDEPPTRLRRSRDRQTRRKMPISEETGLDDRPEFPLSFQRIYSFKGSVAILTLKRFIIMI